MPSGGGIYLDHNATTPTHPKVMAAMAPWFSEGFGNPSSIHALGVNARYAIESAREKAAAALGVSAESVVFTGGGTESNNLAVLGAFWGAKGAQRHIVCSSIEHSSVRRTVEYLEQNHGASVTWLGVGCCGRVNPAEVAAALTPHTVLVCLMAANNETGVVQPVSEISALCGEKRILFHCDSVQLFGKGPLPDALRLPHVTLAISAHKFYGPKGVGALVASPALALPPMIHGGGQERGLRSGTENTPGIVGLGEAAALQSDANAKDHLLQLRQALWAALQDGISGIVQNGDPTHTLPGTLSVSIPQVKGPDVVRRLSQQGVYISAGSACSSGRRELSPVIRALGLDERIPWGALRLSLGHGNTLAQIHTAAQAVVQVVGELRAGVA